MGIKDPAMDPVQRQQRILQEAEDHPSKPDVLAVNQHVVSNLPTMKRIAPSGKRLRKKAWEGDENKRLNICVGALMMIQLNNQLAMTGLYNIRFHSVVFIMDHQTTMVLSIDPIDGRITVFKHAVYENSPRNVCTGCSCCYFCMAGSLLSNTAYIRILC